MLQLGHLLLQGYIVSCGRLLLVAAYQLPSSPLMLLLPAAGVMLLLLLVLSSTHQLMFKAWLTGENICWLIKLLLLLLALWRTPAATMWRRLLACAAVTCWG